MVERRPQRDAVLLGEAWQLATVQSRVIVDIPLRQRYCSYRDSLHTLVVHSFRYRR
jgi:hypothetical protein